MKKLLKSSRGEMSTGVIIGLVLLVIIVVALILVGRSNKTADVTTDTEIPALNDTSSAMPVGSDYTGNPADTTIVTPPAETPTTNPTLPQTGFGPDGE